MEGRIPFRVAIVTLVVGLLAITCGALIGYGVYTNQRNYEILKRDYLDQVAQSTALEVARLPIRTERLLRVERERLESGQYATRDGMGLAGALAAALEGDPELHWMSFGEASGRFMGARRLSAREVVLNVSDPRRNRGIPSEFRAGSLEPYVQTPPLDQPYDPRTRIWYRRAVAIPDDIVWIGPYVFAEGVTGITAAVAVRDRAQRIRGVLTVDYSLAGLTRFLEQVKVADGAVVIFDHLGTMIAAAPGPGREAAVRAADAWEGVPPPADSVRRGQIVLAGEKWEVAGRAIAYGDGPEWMVVAAVREEAFMGPVYANRRMAIVIALGGVAVALLVGFLVSSLIARSLGNAARALDRVAKYQLEEPAPPRSMVKEIFRLERAVRRVTASLRSFTRYAPEEIVRDIVATGREAMLSGERREVTVLFSDLRGFTAFAEKLSPEAVVAILNDHFDLLVGIIVRNGGFVVDFLGDAVFAVFGAPEAHADHVERAVRCAMEMQRARAARDLETRARGWPPMEMGVGLDTGAAVIGNMGSQRRIKYGVVGHVVNVAARIESFTVGGQVLVSDAVRAALGDARAARGPLEIAGKGVGATLRLWELLAPPMHELAALKSPLDARLRLMAGKQIDPHAHPARLRRLGAAGAELESQAPLAVFGALQVLLEGLAVDGKVVELKGRTALVRFTGADWDTRARLEALAASSP
jgi:adenylate cyclase